MPSRITILIIAAIVLYVSLSIYHWRQVKKIPGADRQNVVHGVLTRDSREKNWVQVTTSAVQPGRIETDPAPSPPTAVPVDSEKSGETDQPATAGAITADSEDTVTAVPTDALQAVRAEKDELQKALQHGQSINRQQSLEIKALQDRIVSLQSRLEETSGLLQEKDIVLGELKKQSSTAAGLTAAPVDDDAAILKRALAAKQDALNKANERIAALAERLDRAVLSLTEAENTAFNLRKELTDNEKTGIRARQEADKLLDELTLAREEKERYLAETGRLSGQLRQLKSRQAYLAAELDKARLSKEALLRYGKEQTDLVTPFRQRIEILNGRLEDRKTDLLKAEEEIDAARDRQHSLEKKLQNLQLELRKYDRIEHELKRTAETLRDERRHGDELNGQLQVLADQLNEKISLLDKLEQELARQRTTLRETEEAAAAREEKIERQQQELLAARDTIASSREQLSAAAARQRDLENTVQETGTAREQLAATVAAREKDLNSARTELDRLQGALAQRDQQLAETKNALQASLAKLRDLQAARENSPGEDRLTAEKDATISRLQNDLDTARAKLSTSAGEIRELKRLLSEAKKNSSAAAEAEKLQEEMDRLERRLADSEKQRAAGVHEITRLEEENGKLREMVSSTEQKNSEAAARAAELAAKHEELNETLAQAALLEGKVNDLQSELDRRETAYFTMRDEHIALQEKYASLQKERDTLLPYTMDSDNDSVSDAEDRCPETAGGLEVGRDGCERDSDGDTIVDRLDLCPEAPVQGDINAFGCTGGAPIVLSGLFFSGGNAELSPGNRVYLDKVVSALKQQQDVHCEIGGHTDSIGEPDRNLTVSRQRAESVRNYLVASGIEPDRLTAAGYGSQFPIADNSTEEGRAANRRVELRIIAQESPQAASE